MVQVWAREGLACSTWTARKWPRSPWSTRTPVTFAEDETFDIGQDTRTGVAMVEYRYDVPFKFTGKINKLTFKLGPEQPTATQLEQVHEAIRKPKN